MKFLNEGVSENSAPRSCRFNGGKTRIEKTGEKAKTFKMISVIIVLNFKMMSLQAIVVLQKQIRIITYM